MWTNPQVLAGTSILKSLFILNLFYIENWTRFLTFANNTSFPQGVTLPQIYDSSKTMLHFNAIIRPLAFECLPNIIS